MSSQFPPDIQQSISAHLANGTFSDETEVLRAAMRLLDQRQEDLASIQRGLDDIANGKVRSAEESNEEFRRTHSIPTAP